MIIKLMLFSLTVFYLTAQAHVDWNIKDLLNVQLVAPNFIYHTKEGYLIQNINYGPIKPYFDLLNKYSYQILHSRGEAHITVVTPIEYNDDLKKYISMDEINKIALEDKIQSISVTPVCIGRGRIVNKEQMDTYYVVMKSSGLVDLRKKIYSLYHSRGGKTFNPEHYYPHITIGYTERDLHEADGVIKDEKSCLPELHVSSLPSSVDGMNEIPNMHLVHAENGSSVYRSNAPLNYNNLKKLKDKNIENMIIFKNDKAGEVRSEKAGFLSLGMSEENWHHIDFDWKDNEDYRSGCQKIFKAIGIINKSVSDKKSILFHCTTGEDRTGVLAALYKLTKNTNASFEDLFKNEMCARGFEAGDKTKAPEVVARIRNGLSKTFLKTTLIMMDHLPQIKEGVLDESWCQSKIDEKKLADFEAQHVHQCI